MYKSVIKECSGYFGHELQAALISFFPDWLVAKFLHSAMRKIRIKALKKIKQQK